MKVIKIVLGSKQNFVMEGGMYAGFPFQINGKETWVREGFSQEELKWVVLQTLTSGKEDEEVLAFLEVPYKKVAYSYECLWSGAIKQDYKIVDESGDLLYPNLNHFEVEVE